MADLYIVLYDSIVTNPATTGHGREGFYFGVNGEHTLYDVGKAIGEALVAIGKIDNPEPTTLTKEELDKYPVSRYSSDDLNQRARLDVYDNCFRGRRIWEQILVLWQTDHDLLVGSQSRRLKTSLPASIRRLFHSFKINK